MATVKSLEPYKEPLRVSIEKAKKGGFSVRKGYDDGFILSPNIDDALAEAKKILTKGK